MGKFTVTFGKKEVPMEREQDYNRFHLEIRFSDEETPEDKRRVYKNSFYSLLKDVDEDSIDDLNIARSMNKRLYEGGDLSPHTNQEVTNDLLQLAVNQAFENIDINGEITSIYYIRVIEENVIRETPLSDIGD